MRWVGSGLCEVWSEIYACELVCTGQLNSPECLTTELFTILCLFLLQTARPPEGQIIYQKQPPEADITLGHSLHLINQPYNYLQSCKALPLQPDIYQGITEPPRGTIQSALQTFQHTLVSAHHF